RPEMGLSSFDGRSAAMEDYLSTHKELISSPIIVDKAVRKRKLKDLPTFAAGQNPTGAILASLKVTREMGENSRIGTSILSLSFTGPVSEDCNLIIDAIIESYIEFLDTKYRDVSKDMMKMIEDAKEVLEK